jgi:ADP-ribose pyrophosphatase YjhB (NUDIX family)
MPDGQHTIIDVHVLLVRGDELLLIRRRGTYGDGMWHLPSGKLDAGESLPAAAAREGCEEVGVFIDPADLQHVHTLHVAGSGPAPRLGVFFEARRWVWQAVQPRTGQMFGCRVVSPGPPAR